MTARRRLLASGLTLALGAGLLVASAGTAAAATITVNSLADDGSGACELREAITNANNDDQSGSTDCSAGSGDDTITFSVTGTILLLGGQLTVNEVDGDDLTIQGPGENLLTLSGGGVDRVLVADTPLFLDGLTVANGNDGGGNGGGILNNSTLTITNSTLSDNSATGGGSGGGIFNNSTLSTLTITNSTLSDNDALGGGGIHNFGGTVTITDSTLSGNHADAGGGGVYSSGGAVKITDSTLSGNDADYGGGIYISDDTVKIIDSTLAGNDAASDGGGIYNEFGALTVTDSTLSDNSATGGGGGIFNGFDGNLTITNSTLSGNSADSGGGIFDQGGFLSVTASTLSGNTALEGGGIFIDGGLDPLILDSTLEGNHADFDGGGIYNLGFLVITNSTFNANTADGRGGGLFNGNAFLSPVPGTLFVSAARAEITNATFSGNSALGEVELLPITSLAPQQAGGGIFNGGDSVPTSGKLHPTSVETSPVTLKGTIVDHSLGGDCSGPIFDGGYNLDSDDSCELSDENGSLPSTDPDLEPLEDNGGPTETMALNTGSPALDLIPPGVCEHFLGHSPEDQRGVVRPQGEGCDIGAFELEEGGTTPPPPPEQRWTEQTTIDLRGPFGAASASLGTERSSFKLKGTLYARHWFCQHNSQINLILVGQGQIGSTFTNGAGDFAFLTSLPQGETQASYKARFPQKKGQPGRCKGSVSDPLVVTGG